MAVTWLRDEIIDTTTVPVSGTVSATYPGGYFPGDWLPDPVYSAEITVPDGPTCADVDPHYHEYTQDGGGLYPDLTGDEWYQAGEYGYSGGPCGARIAVFWEGVTYDYANYDYRGTTYKFAGEYHNAVDHGTGEWSDQIWSGYGDGTSTVPSPSGFSIGAPLWKTSSTGLLAEAITYDGHVTVHDPGWLTPASPATYYPVAPLKFPAFALPRGSKIRMRFTFGYSMGWATPPPEPGTRITWNYSGTIIVVSIASIYSTGYTPGGRPAANPFLLRVRPDGLVRAYEDDPTVCVERCDRTDGAEWRVLRNVPDYAFHPCVSEDADGTVYTVSTNLTRIYRTNVLTGVQTLMATGKRPFEAWSPGWAFRILTYWRIDGAGPNGTVYYKRYDPSGAAMDGSEQTLIADVPEQTVSVAWQANGTMRAAYSDGTDLKTLTSNDNGATWA